MAAIPLSYNLRSLRVRKTTTFATAGGIALVVLVVSCSNMLGAGIERALGTSGRPDVAIVLSKAADAELASGIELAQVGLITAQVGVATAAGGTPDAVGEVVGVLAMDKLGTDGISNVQVRGVSENAWEFRPEVQIAEGRKPRAGTDEVAVGRAIAGRFRGLALGESFEIRRNRNVQVVGVMESDGSSFESEVWGDIDTVRGAFGREGLVSSVRVRLTSAELFDGFKASIEENRQLGFDVHRESDYYVKQSENTALFMRVMGYLIAFFFSVGAMIGAMITMYAAIANRSREIGTLRALGFSKFAILSSFLVESVLLAFLGGVVGALASTAMALVQFSVVNFASWSEIVFRFEPTPGGLGASLLVAVVMGLLGGLFPAISAARMNVLEALRG